MNKKQIKASLVLLLAVSFFFVQDNMSSTQEVSKDTFKQAILPALEADVLNEMNAARTNPAAYAEKLKALLKYFDGYLLNLPGKIALRTNEGTRAVSEAINFLQRQSPISPLKASEGMSCAARDHVRDQGHSGRTGHNGSDGSSPFTRMNRYGSWQRTAGENIDYGNNKGDMIIMSLIIDDGVPSRGHRNNIFNQAFKVTGIACGSHRQYRHMCVIGYAGGYTDK